MNLTIYVGSVVKKKTKYQPESRYKSPFARLERDQDCNPDLGGTPGEKPVEKFYVVIWLSHNHHIRSIPFTTYDEAAACLIELRDQMNSGDKNYFTELPWLTVKASDILSVHISNNLDMY